MMELAPKGTGKSFIYSNLSRYVWLNSGGALTQAQLFMNLNTKDVGLLGKYDLLVLDEGQSINFKGADDIHAKFKDYLESGQFSIGREKITSECGLIILANIELYDGKPRQTDYIKNLPEMFHDDALLDRFHGIVPGWEIPRFTTESAAQGYGIKADVFGQYLHQLRTVSHVDFPFGDCPHLKGDSRDVKAVTRLASALSKLLLLNPDHPEYEQYVLNPAIELRQRVRGQLAELNPHEFKPYVEIYKNN
jgi:ATP-dependent Lon protease